MSAERQTASLRPVPAVPTSLLLPFNPVSRLDSFQQTTHWVMKCLDGDTLWPSATSLHLIFAVDDETRGQGNVAWAKGSSPIVCKLSTIIVTHARLIQAPSLKAWQHDAQSGCKKEKKRSKQSLQIEQPFYTPLGTMRSFQSIKVLQTHYIQTLFCGYVCVWVRDTASTGSQPDVPWVKEGRWLIIQNHDLRGILYLEFALLYVQWAGA